VQPGEGEKRDRGRGREGGREGHEFFIASLVLRSPAAAVAAATGADAPLATASLLIEAATNARFPLPSPPLPLSCPLGFADNTPETPREGQIRAKRA